MRTTSTTDAPAQTSADTIAVGVFEDEGVPHDLPGGELEALLDAGEARRAFKHVAVWHDGGRRWLLVGLGRRERFDGERARVAAAAAQARAKELRTRVLCWEVPHHVDDAVVAGLVQGTVLSAYRFDRFKSSREDDQGIEELIVSAHHDVSRAVGRAAVVAGAVNACRDLQNAPANAMTPAALAERALALEGVRVEVEGPAEIEARGMGSFMAVARGSYEEPRLITLSYDPAERPFTPHVVFVGKAVTFDSGGISIKPGAKMADMKFDMSGGAAVVEAVGAIARLGLPVRVTGIVGATENMPSGRSMRPSDVVTAMNGTTIEIVNTDCEGRMVLADCLAYAVELGAERIVDLATLTGATANFLGSTYAALLANDDAWAAELLEAGQRSGELAWRLPLHDEYAELIKGSTGDIVNLNEPRSAGAITAAHFLERFVGDVPWAHLDIAGVADGLGRDYARKGGSGWGVRLLVELAESLSRR